MKELKQFTCAVLPVFAALIFLMFPMTVYALTKTVKVYPSMDSYIQTWPEGDMADTNMGGSSNMLVGAYVNSGEEARPLLQFDLSSIKGKITDATLKLNRYYKYYHKPLVVNVHRVVQAWDESSVSWNGYDGSHNWTSAGGDFDSAIVAGATLAAEGTGTYPGSTKPEFADDTWYQWDVTGLVLDWANGVHPNHGLLLRSETYWHVMSGFRSKEYGDSAYWPYLEVTYETGVAFSTTSYTFDTTREFNGVGIEIENTGDLVKKVYGIVVNAPSDIQVSFIGLGEENNPMPISPGQSKDLSIGILLSNANQISYAFDLKLYTTSSASVLVDTATINLNLPSWDEYDAGVSEDAWNILLSDLTSSDNLCLDSKQEFTVTNTGNEPISDLSVSATGDLELFLSPEISDFKITAGQSTTFMAYAIVDDTTPDSTATIHVAGANFEKTIPVQYTAPDETGTWTYASTEGNYITSTVRSFVCVNRPNYSVKLRLPSNVDLALVSGASVIMAFENVCGSVQPHDTYVSLNSTQVKTWENQVTIGEYEFDVDPALLQHENTLSVSTEDYKGRGHFCANAYNTIKAESPSYAVYCPDLIKECTDDSETDFVDGIDNDCDGAVDCEDLDSCGSALCDNPLICPPDEICDNGIDDNRNGLVDSQDWTVCPPFPPVVTGATPTNDTTPAWSWDPGGGGSGTYRYRMNDADLTEAVETVDMSYAPQDPVLEGTHVLYVQEKDADDSWSVPGSFEITIDTSPPTSEIAYNPTAATNQDVTATITLSDGSITSEGGSTHIFTENGSFTFEFTDEAGNTGSAAATVDWMDKEAPTAGITYSTTDPVNQDVMVTLNPSEDVTVTNNEGLLTRTFTENGEFTFQFVDAAGNSGTATATVDNIDRTLLFYEIDYDPATATNQDVVAMITIVNGTVTGAGGDTHTFTENGSFTFEFEDAGGNPDTSEATVDWIDKEAPTATITYSTTEPTHGDVAATLDPSEDVTVTNNEGLTTRTFTENGEFTFEFEDAVGNTGTATATVSNIETTTLSYEIAYNPATMTNQDVVATITLSEGTVTSAGGSTHTFTENGSFTFEFEDAGGNPDTAVATVDWIVNAPLAGDLNGDGSINLKDLVLTLQIIAGRVLVEPAHLEADVNGDGKIGLAEAIYILQRIVGFRS